MKSKPNQMHDMEINMAQLVREFCQGCNIKMHGGKQANWPHLKCFPQYFSLYCDEATKNVINGKKLCEIIGLLCQKASSKDTRNTQMNMW